MPDFLRVNGVLVPVAVGSAELRPEAVGESGRGVDGTLFVQRTAIKRGYSFSTSPVVAQEALALEGLLHGVGHVWPASAERGLYSSRGALVTVATRTTAGGKFGGDSLTFSDGATANFGVPYAVSAAGPTISFWHTSGASPGTWVHRAYRAAISQWYANGAPSAAPSGLTIGYSAGWTFTAAGGQTHYMDDVWLCPYDWPATWPAMVHAYNAPVGLTPRLRADGLAIGDGVVTLDALGEVTSMPLLPGVIGAFAANLHTVDFSLMEV